MAASPMFPLGSVLFPFVPIPLRVFEPRYLTMVGRLLDEDEPEFGVVLIERGSEAGGGDQRASVGTMARLVSAAVGADDLLIVGVGTRRFTVERWLDDDPYPQAELSTLPELEWSEALAPLRVEAEAVVRRVIARVADPESDADIDLSEDPVAAVWQLAAIAPLGEYDRYSLLRSTSMGDLLRQLIDLTLDAEELWSAD
jgi:Lon protease-like protein